MPASQRPGGRRARHRFQRAAHFPKLGRIEMDGHAHLEDADDHQDDATSGQTETRDRPDELRGVARKPLRRETVPELPAHALRDLEDPAADGGDAGRLDQRRDRSSG